MEKKRFQYGCNESTFKAVSNWFEMAVLMHLKVPYMYIHTMFIGVTLNLIAFTIDVFSL